MLDVEVKRFRKESLFRCISKGENIGATTSDRIVIETRRGTVTIAGAVATVALAADDAATGLPRRGNPTRAPLQVLVGAVEPGGFVLLADRTGAVVIVRRPGFVMWVDGAGMVRGPERETAAAAAELQFVLDVAASTATSPWTGDPHLRPLDGIPDFAVALPAVPSSCLTDVCGPYLAPLD